MSRYLNIPINRTNLATRRDHDSFVSIKLWLVLKLTLNLHTKGKLCIPSRALKVIIGFHVCQYNYKSKNLIWSSLIFLFFCSISITCFFFSLFQVEMFLYLKENIKKIIYNKFKIKLLIHKYWIENFKIYKHWFRINFFISKFWNIYN